ncbi:MFS transporter [Staphylococcus pettenkoferi]|uniref:MFS transporter n=1 Tax=Staphylococcus pettenkoferi TaxID=170573 RepID=A0ABT4BL71_9STAP|nr:MFS transporter [Staphylococcus pettenkoferi]MCY1564736.1 MFS transporter [Staphylococcus pettenkoferi]MCY1582522.1 MFS transporter [Staphylococcus pettenkoferi]MCY1589941.1 MFS transporter [Staphylococcus pettenkoferi]MCY1597016.1 MFS transporter [Staphylococcus pettenkoferi]MCY1599744.1 MFS transporter [Staphylococcus pettenkoferi]
MEQELKYNRITTVFFITGIIVMCSLYAAIPMLPHIAKDFGISKATATLNGVVFSLAYSISCLLYGVISDKFGRIKIILIGLIGLVVVSLGIGFVNSFSLLLVLRVFQGIFAATFSPVSLAYTTEMYPPVKRVTAISFISTSFMLSGIIGQNLSEILSNAYGWRVTYIVLSVLYIILTFVVSKLVPESPYRNPDIKLSRFMSHFKDIFLYKSVIGCFFISLTLLTNFISMYTILNDYIKSHFVHGDLTTTFVVKLLGIIGMILSLFAGRISDKLSVIWVIKIALVAQIISLIGLGITSNIVIITFFSIVFVAGIAFCIPSVISKVGMLAATNRGFFLSVNTFILFLGTAIAPVLSIYLEKLTHYFVAFSILSLIALAALIVSFFIPKGINPDTAK